MLFDACDADKIATWKGEIESTIRSMDSLSAEICDYFATSGDHDPATIIQNWDAIQTINHGDTLWGAFLPAAEADAREAAGVEGLELHFGTPPDGYGNANWQGMTLWYVA